MAIDNESVPTPQFPEAIPQTIPELYFWMKVRMEAGFNDTWKEISALKEEMRNVEQRLSEEIRLRYVDLRQRIERLQNSINAMDKRFEWQDAEIANLKKSLRELEHQIDPPLAA